MSRSRIQLCQLGSMILFGLLATAPGLALAQAARSIDRADEPPTPIASTRPNNTVPPATITSPNAIRASIRVEGTPSPGLKVTLDGSASSGGRVWYRWIQTHGPAVEIEGATRVQARFSVPADASSLGFVLVVGNASGVDARSVTIDVEDPERDADHQAFKADAGDDQTAKVGRRVLLNGVRSEPKGKLRYRWVQAGGPKVILKTGDGPTASFVPTMPGTYQFALIVASAAGDLSEPSLVSVTVGGTLRASADAPPMEIDELARVSLASIEGGGKYAEDLSRTFDTVADGIDSFKTFSEALNEMTRRLDAIVPRDKDRRSVWIEQLLSPLWAKVVSGMKSEGLDLAQPEAQAKPLTREQRARLAEQFRYTAAGLRAAKTLR